MKPTREKWSGNFSEWFHEVIQEAGIADYRYPVKGCGVWLPYGFKLRQNILAVLRRLLDDAGHEEVLFPTLITSKMLRQEAEHIGSFEEQTFWVTRAGGKELAEQYALRPTSETAIGPMLNLWIRSHADLPKKLYQVVSIFRHETKATRPLIRVREVTTFKEAHTAHRSMEEAERQVWEAVQVYSRFFDALCIPYLISRRPDWDKFAGALYTVAFDTIFPDGRTLQIGTVHNLGQNFSRAFGISFEREDGTRDLVYQTSYGISERVVAAVLAVHGDDKGLTLPPTVAATQAVIIPIVFKGLGGALTLKCEELKRALLQGGIGAVVDIREKLTPGSKFYDWELKGVPVRLEVGPKDLERRQVVLARRDTLEKTTVKEGEVVEEVRRLLRAVEESLRKASWARLKENLHTAETIEEARQTLTQRGGVIALPWCGEEGCGLKIEERIDAAALGTPYGSKPEEETVRGSCASCGRETPLSLRLAKTY